MEGALNRNLRQQASGLGLLSPALLPVGFS